ncbi:MAG: hypothetical protein Q3966_05685 [Neisseria sp.]|nr:hypothetical protein [Neisseria sp.]
MTFLPALLEYAEQFRRLHTSFTQANNRAPHKFILLYSLCLLYESGSLFAEKIDFTDALLDEWQEIFGRQWRLWVANEYHRENFGMPIYHMKTEPFWRFRVKLGMEDMFEQKNRMKTLSGLRQTVSGVEIDAPLARLLRQAETRKILQDVLLARLFEIL